MKRVAVLFGGRSSEHEVSCVSAQTIVNAMDKNKYEAFLIGITKDGRWLFVDSLDAVKDGSWRQSGKTAVILPDAGMKAVMVFDTANAGEKTEAQLVKIDLAFPALHGLFGEDGTVQGLFELAGIPYVGCGVLASAVSMDKIYTKQIVERLGIRQAKFVPVLLKELQEAGLVAKKNSTTAGRDDAKIAMLVEKIENKLGYPVFVKPSNAGSSCGVSKAHDREELLKALCLAAEHDRKILVEETIVGRELECAVLGDSTAKASGVGEILAAAEFYDYDAKYNNEESKTVISPELPEGKAEEIRRSAARIFEAVDGFGLSRVDFFMEKGTNEIVFNEINTLPGFTPISMYPMLWGEQGIEKPELVNRLLELALER